MSTAITTRVAREIGEDSSPLGMERVAAMVLGVCWPALYFVVRLEDPAGHEPLWQFQLVGMAFLTLVAASLFSTRAARHFGLLFQGLVFVAMLYGSALMAHAGYEAERVSLAALLLASGLALVGRTALLAYIASFVAATVVGMWLVEPGLMQEATVMGRVLGGAVVIASIGMARGWALERVVESERRYRSVVEMCPVPLLLVANDRCLMVSGSAEELLGLRRGDAVDAVLGHELPWWRSADEHGQATATVPGSDGEPRHYDVIYGPVRSVSEGLPAENVLQVLFVERTELEARTRAKDDLFARVNRELRAPLATIEQALQSTSSLVGDVGRDQQVREALRGTRNLRQLADQLVLARTASDDGTTALLSDAFSSVDVAERAVKLARRAATQRKVQLDLDAVGSNLPMLQGKLEDIVQALANLVNNAVRYSPRQGRVRVTVASEDTSAAFYVHSDGHALSDEIKTQIRDALSVTGQAEEAIDTGSGVAFSITRSLVERAGGSVGCEFGTHGGLTFTMRLPAV